MAAFTAAITAGDLVMFPNILSCKKKVLIVSILDTKSPRSKALFIIWAAPASFFFVLKGKSLANKACAATDMDSHSCVVANPMLKVSEYAAMDTVPNLAAAADVTVYADILAMVRKRMRPPALKYDLIALESIGSTISGFDPVIPSFAVVVSVVVVVVVVVVSAAFEIVNGHEASLERRDKGIDLLRR